MQESIQSIKHILPRTLYQKVTKTQDNITYKEVKRSVLSQQVSTRLQETDMAVWQRQTQITKQKPQKKTQ